MKINFYKITPRILVNVWWQNPKKLQEEAEKLRDVLEVSF